MTSFTVNGIAYDRGGPRGEPPVVIIHAGVADRGMWDPVWPQLTADRDVVRLDLRGFGDSAARPATARRAFEVTAGWDDVEEQEPDRPALDRLGEIEVPVLVLVGELDLDAVHAAAGRVVAGVAGARRVDWPDAGHLPSLEKPAAFAVLLREWVTETPAPAG